MYLNYFSYSWEGIEGVIEEVSGQFLKTIDKYFNLCGEYHKSVLHTVGNGNFFENENCQLFRIKNKEDFMFYHIVTKKFSGLKKFEKGESKAIWRGESKMYMFSNSKEKGLVERLNAVSNKKE